MLELDALFLYFCCVKAVEHLEMEIKVSDILALGTAVIKSPLLVQNLCFSLGLGGKVNVSEFVKSKLIKLINIV